MREVQHPLYPDEIWPRCPVDGCPNHACIRLGSEKCYPHTFGLPSDAFTRYEHKENIEPVVESREE